VIHQLRAMFQGCIILKNDSSYLQGVPDLLLLWRDRWAAIEVKSGPSAPVQPNQEEYVAMMDAMSFAGFIHPQNEEVFLRELHATFTASGTPRVSQRQQISLDELRQRQASRSVQERASGASWD
jgi:hypothetical protein